MTSLRYGTSVASQAPAGAPVQSLSWWRRHRGLGIAAIAIAVAVVAAAFVVGVRGLFASPVRSLNSDGTTTLAGTYEPYQPCATFCEGYVQAGARSVFVRLPDGCPEPGRDSPVTVIARPALDLGKGSYRATGCIRPG